MKGSGEEEKPSQRPECYYSRISQPEVKVALWKMGKNKAVGPDQIPIEAWRCLGDEAVEWLCSLKMLHVAVSEVDGNNVSWIKYGGTEVLGRSSMPIEQP
ncbi:hypothetical protein CTI12_AA244260 [Artemisia annua]|uniref:Uncharacterized protein n=1 Tax=Artemisia annua TaxID=35608 RepID=A0A2U1NNT4_ARTAN|nr:hypothetical protein CTI12_AA244260 [Artemisia annua]